MKHLNNSAFIRVAIRVFPLLPIVKLLEADLPRLEILQTQSFRNTLLLKISNGVYANYNADLRG